MFFVISGYLITSILIGELAKGSFSIVRFYERRARRILPALFVVMLACMPFAYMWMLPSQLKDFGQSLIAVVFFASNILFWREDGYFASAAELKPLLHTWSLAVEEQYYLLFPLFLLLFWRFGRRHVFWSVVAIAALSLLLAEWGWRNEPSGNFYLAPARTWELLAGSICAFLTVGKAQRSSNLLSTAGLALILLAIFAYDENTPFPSVYTLVPVVGTALIILFAAEDTWVARLLSMRGFVGIGLISYSAYLWHQPLFAFSRLRSLTEPGHSVMAALAVTALLLAWATWYYVEQVFRKRANPVLVAQRGVFVASGTIGAVFVVIGVIAHSLDGLPNRVKLSNVAENDLNVRRLAAECFDFDYRNVDRAGDWFCEAGGKNNFKHTIAVIGDSHALSYFGPLNDFSEKNSIRLKLNGLSSCPPFIDAFVRGAGMLNDGCGERNAVIFSDRSLDDVDAVVLIARWTYYGYGDITGVVRHIGLTNDVITDDEQSLQAFWELYENTLISLKSRQIPVVVVHQPPVQEVGAVAVFQRAASSSESLGSISGAVSVDISEHNGRYEKLFGEMIDISSRIGGLSVVHVDVAPALCDPTCHISRNGRAVYFDNDHISNYGAQLALPKVVAAIEELLEK